MLQSLLRSHGNQLIEDLSAKDLVYCSLWPPDADKHCIGGPNAIQNACRDVPSA